MHYWTFLLLGAGDTITLMNNHIYHTSGMLALCELDASLTVHSQAVARTLVGALEYPYIIEG